MHRLMNAESKKRIEACLPLASRYTLVMERSNITLFVLVHQGKSDCSEYTSEKVTAVVESPLHVPSHHPQRGVEIPSS